MTVSPTSKERLVLIDSNALIHRSFHAVPPLRNKEGELVNAVYGFTSIFLKILSELKPKYILAAFDLPKPTFRHREYADYKAHRPKTPEDLRPQFNKVKKLLEVFDVPIFTQEGFEADDIIGTIVKLTGSQIEDMVVTGDLDILQLVDQNTKVYILKRGMSETTIYDSEAVQARYGFEPEQLTDFKGLRGDPSDNIPGVPGIGEKTASRLIKEFKTIENLYQKLEQNKGKGIKETLRKKLIENKEQAFFSKKLATIRLDVPLKFNLATCRLETYSHQKVVRLLEELGFKSLIRRLPSRQLTI